jgi:hypothetical protein
MIPFGPATRIFLAPGPTDMRRSFDGLSELVRHSMGGRPVERSSLYLYQPAPQSPEDSGLGLQRALGVRKKKRLTLPAAGARRRYCIRTILFMVAERPNWTSLDCEPTWSLSDCRVVGIVAFRHGCSTQWSAPRFEKPGMQLSG